MDLPNKKQDVALYHDALHILLNQHRHGLEFADITERLNINDSSCKKLIALEEYKGYLIPTYPDLETGVVFYKSTRGLAKYVSLDAELTKIKERKQQSNPALLLALFVVMVGMVGMILQIESPQSSKPANSQSGLTEQDRVDKDSNEVRQYVEAQAAERRRVALTEELVDLKSRIQVMESIRNQRRCYASAGINSDCLIQGRFLSKVELDYELTLMHVRIGQIQKDLASH